MAQLVKLLDYVSRYETDLTRYPTQFIRLKRRQWEQLRHQWEQGAELSFTGEPIEEEPEKKTKFSSLFKLFSSSNARDEKIEGSEEEQEDEEEVFGFQPNLIYRPDTIEQLKKMYLDQLFHFQIKWASSTLIDESRVHPKYLRDSLLRSFTSQLPDSFFVFYEPIVQLKKSKLQLDVIIMTPMSCLCITVLEAEDLAAFEGDGGRFWTKRIGEEEVKFVNPLLSMNRMAIFMKQLFNKNKIDFPIQKYVISRNGYIDYPNVAFDIEMIDRRTYDEWFNSIRRINVPMKFAQFQATQALLDVGQTTASSRLFQVEEDWEEEEEVDF